MNARVAAAQAALQAGRQAEAVELLAAALTEDPNLPSDVWLLLARQLFLANRFPEAESWIDRAIARHPQSYQLWNIRGAVLRTLKRPAEALAALDHAISLEPGQTAAQINRAYVLSDAGERDQADRQFRAALAIDPTLHMVWMQLAGLHGDSPNVALAILDRALETNPAQTNLLAARAQVLRDAGRRGELIAFLADLVRRFPNGAWPHFDLGNLLVITDHARGVALLRRAVALEPSLRHRVALANGLNLTMGAGEAEALEEAWPLCRDALATGPPSAELAMILRETFSKLVALDEAEALGDPISQLRAHIAAGHRAPLVRHMAEIRTDADRLELLAQHRVWGAEAQRRADQSPLPDLHPRRSNGKLRLGLMSSDLRDHVVGRFAAPLFDHLDPERFELFAYSFHPGAEDQMQARLARRATAFRWWPETTSRAAAGRIADDRLDMLIDLGGHTGKNRPEVLAWRPAAILASWLAYPHSVGLQAIDYLICDPHNAPLRPELLIERPLMMPSSWVVLGDAYSDDLAIAPDLPEDRAGFVTFGTANAPYKYNRATLEAWARIVAETPGSRFAFVRPEAGAPTFQANVAAAFAAKGVEASRLIFHPGRGDHMARYNDVDITLDPFPVTGGTTTIDSLWMGVPVVSLAGPSFFERLSRSLLMNTALDDLIAETVDAYVQVAVSLAADRPRRVMLRRDLRPRIHASALGQPATFARDFYDLVARTIADHR